MRAGFVTLKNKTLESNNNQENTPTRRRPLHTSLRTPLQSRDENTMLRTAPLTAKSGNATNNMPYDKPNRPLMPTLSASATKTTSRTPLTPRVAGSAPPAATTPLARRGTRPDNLNTPPVGSSKEDLSTPVSTFLNNNITPRSGSRKSRVDSTNTTPVGTPNGTPVPPSNEFPRIAGDGYGGGLGIAGLDKTPKRQTVTFSPAISDAGHAKSPGPSTDSKFFFASEAKTAQTPSRPQAVTKNSSTFLYANGDLIPPLPQSSSTSEVGSNIGEDRSQPKFFHANGTPDLLASPNFTSSRPSSAISARITSPRLTGTSHVLPQYQRPASPQKLSQQASIAPLRTGPSLPVPPASRPQTQGRGQSTNSITVSRKSSLENGQRIANHGRSASVDSPEPKTAKRVSSGSSFDSGTSPPPTASLNLLTTVLPTSTPETEEVSEESQTDSEIVPSGLQSPVKIGHSIEHLNELAANARRERKVLDLEIRTTSLEAINRTLEREMRKQSAELRRYRRLSRSGRLSINTAASIRSASGNLSIAGSIEGTVLSDMSEEDSAADSEPDSSDSEPDSIDDGSLSPGAMAESDLRHRKKDEKRLQLDLSKHQQLLVDSQKMNQSLKRCLGWTEELITEGKKALEYHVRVSDVELGGRVLAPDEVERDNEEAGGLGDEDNRMLSEARMDVANDIAIWETATEAGDRDSGIEIDPDAQRERFEETTNLIPLPPSADG